MYVDARGIVPDIHFVLSYTTALLRLTPRNVPTKFCWNNRNRFGEKCKNVISDH